MRILSLLIIILLSLISCSTTQTSQPNILVWKESYTGMVSHDKMKEKINNLINSLIDEFLNDYQKVKSEQENEKRKAI